MWLLIEKTKEYIPFDTEHTDKVFLDGEKGWAIKQKDGKVYHVSKEQYEQKMLRELDSDAFWKMRQIKEATEGLSQDEINQVKKILKGLKKEKKEAED